VPAGTTFRGSIPPESENFVHQAETANIADTATYTDDPLINGEPDLAVSATQNWNPGGGVGVYNDYSVGVFYDVDRWAVYNKDGARMPAGAAFNVAASNEAKPAK
jgi:hypothetical protein